MKMCLDNITYYMCIYNTSCHLQSTMIVIRCLCIYSLLLSIEIAPAPRTLRSVFLHHELFYFKGKNKFVANMKYQEFSILVSLLLRMDF